MTTMEVGRRLVELCNQKAYCEAIEELYADDARSIQPVEMPGMPRETVGKVAILEAARAWVANSEVHSAEVTGPFPHDDRFICFSRTSFTMKVGPTAGQRMTLEEACECEVRDGSIILARYYYSLEP